MEDTPPEIKQKFYEMIMARTPEERLKMCSEMFDTAVAMIRVTMPEGLNPDEQKRYIYKKIHGEDLPEDFEQVYYRQKAAREKREKKANL